MNLTVDDLEEIKDVLRCEEIRTDWFRNRFTFTKDPDGQPIELKERKVTTASYNPEEKWVQEYRKQFGKEASFFEKISLLY